MPLTPLEKQLRDALTNIRQVCFVMCEATENEFIPDVPLTIADGAYHSGLGKDYGGRPNPKAYKRSEFTRGRAYEAKHIRKALGELFNAAFAAVREKERTDA